MTVQDERIPKLRDAVRAMEGGDFRVQLPGGAEDDVSLLARDLERLAKSLDCRFTECRALAQITEKINAGFLMDEVLDHIYDSLHRFIPYDRIGFSLLEDRGLEGLWVRAQWARSDTPNLCLDKNFAAPLHGSSLEQMIHTGEPRIINDLAAYLEEHPASTSTRLIVEEGMRSNFTCPLLALGRPVGFLFFTSRRVGAYQDAHVGFFLEIAGQLSTIVEKSRLYERLLVRDKFLGMAAHDLRSPVTVMKSYLDLLAGEYLGAVDESQREILRKMDDTCHKMLHLIKDLLDVTAIESGDLHLTRRRMDIRPLVREVLAACRLYAHTKRIDLVDEMSADLAHVWADPDRVDQIINNLVSNAVKYSPPGTTVKLRVENHNHGLRITVMDQGPGLREDEIQHLFRPFFRASARPTGGESSTGLGLAIVKRLVDAHDGRVGVDTVQGSGSAFWFTLPGANIAHK